MIHKVNICLIFIALTIFSCKTKTENKAPISGNHLINESSAYLLQHAHNPVDWYPWSDAALEKAKKENKLMIISIGYSSCHWCHVMEKESFSDTAVSRFMNEHFVCIKVDREERPDIDNVYMSDCQKANPGACGWPLNAITNSEGKTVWVTTYLSKEEWLNALKSIQSNYDEDPNEVEKMTRNFYRGEEFFSDSKSGKSEFKDDILLKQIEIINTELDYVNGGKKTDIKFPLPSLLRACLEIGTRQNNPKLIQFVETTLSKISNGGMQDQLEGGFARYSTDPLWKVPHFEKMLYDNAQLISMYSFIYQKTKKPYYKKIIDKTLNFINKEMTSTEGGFYASFDADSEHEEGKYYVWTLDEIKNALQDQKELNLAISFYGFTKEGNWEHGKNVLAQAVDKNQFLKDNKITENEFDNQLASIQQKLLAAKSNRKKPNLDKKIICSWNAMMTRAYADAAMALSSEDYKSKALKSGEFILKNLLKDSTQLYRTINQEKTSALAFLDDYAFVIDAFIRLYELSFDEKWLNIANQLMHHVLENYSHSDNSLFYYNDSKSSNVGVRKIEIDDQVIPSSNSVICDNLHKLGLYFDEPDMINRSQNMLNIIFNDKIKNGPSFYTNWLRIYQEYSKPMYEVAIVGDKSNEKRNELAQYYIPHMILLGGNNEGTLELLKEKLQEGETYIYVCRNKVCKLPVQEVAKAIPLIQ